MSATMSKDKLIESLRRAIARADEFAVRVHYTLLRQRGMSEGELERIAKEEQESEA